MVYESPNHAMRQAKVSDRQKDLLREVWAETVSRVKPILDVDEIAAEWLALSEILERYRIEANERYCLHLK
jgi:hypothetical protein